MFRLSIVITASCMLIVSEAGAASISNVQGVTLIDRGDGFVEAHGDSQVAPADRVFVKTGTADLVYDNGCVIKLNAEETVAVLVTPPSCHAAFEVPAVALYAGGGLLAAGGVGLGIALSPRRAVSP